MWLPENVGVLGIMPAFIKRYIDHYEAALNEAGDILIPMQEGIFTEKHIIGDITDHSRQAKDLFLTFASKTL